MMQTRYLSKRAARRIGRHEYPDVERNPLALCSWASKPPNIGSITRLAEAYMARDLYALKSPMSGAAVGTTRWQPLTVTWELRDAAIASGLPIVALEQTDESVSMFDAELPEQMCLLIGNESSGLPQSALDIADMAVEIPQYGMVGSLNVATATAIALYEWSRQHRAVARSLWRSAA